MLLSFSPETQTALAIAAAVLFAAFLLIYRKKRVSAAFTTMLSGLVALFIFDRVAPSVGADFGVNFYTVFLSLSLGLPGSIAAFLFTILFK
ncbi:MAG: pro-sigmaK processing inhibitor BofA family protein [Oscillospiraceae bacterium]|jgi:hypothetical protein|nr:pro-sigmaK processing inhibitor BofA family protein [Oscillospiraceae bacterium]